MANWELPPPPKLNEGGGAIKWTPSHTKDRCADCQQLIYDAMMAGGKVVPPVPNVARYKRTRADVVRFVCIEHTQMRKLQEGS